MVDTRRRLAAPEWLIVAGSSIFIFILALSAVFQADIRWLHFFQAWMYVATIILALRPSRLGYFIGISAAGLWDYGNLFATSFFVNGLNFLAQWAQTGKLKGVDQMIAVRHGWGTFWWWRAASGLIQACRAKVPEMPEFFS